MQGSQIAKRYAKGLMMYAEETQQEAIVCQEMKLLLSLLKEDRTLRNFLKTPIIESKKKNEIIQAAFADFSNTTRQLLQLLVSHRRANFAALVAEAYVEEYNEANDIKELAVTTAVPLDDNLLKRILAKIQPSFEGKKLELIPTVDESIIGGFIVRLGDKQVDTSIKSKLDRLSQEFSTNQYIPKL